MQADAPKILTDVQRTKIETRLGYRFNNIYLIDQAFLGEGDSAEFNAGRKPGRYVQDRVSLAFAGRIVIERVRRKFDIDIDLCDSDLGPAFRGKDYTSSAEAFIGAVAMDCNNNLDTISRVIGVMLLSSWRSFCKPHVEKFADAPTVTA